MGNVGVSGVIGRSKGSSMHYNSMLSTNKGRLLHNSLLKKTKGTNFTPKKKKRKKR